MKKSNKVLQYHESQRNIESVTSRVKKDTGITLIALVVTIVVLLILARSSYFNINRRKPD